MHTSITDRICTLNIEKRKLLQLKKYDTMFDRIDENTNNTGRKGAEHVSYRQEIRKKDSGN